MDDDMHELLSAVFDLYRAVLGFREDVEKSLSVGFDNINETLLHMSKEQKSLIEMMHYELQLFNSNCIQIENAINSLRPYEPDLD